MDWLIHSYAIAILPSVASLKTLRRGSQVSSAHKPIIAFADPIDIAGGVPVLVDCVIPVGDQAAADGEKTLPVDRRQLRLCRKPDDYIAMN
jgi:hypothetical protein